MKFVPLYETYQEISRSNAQRYSYRLNGYNRLQYLHLPFPRSSFGRRKLRRAPILAAPYEPSVDRIRLPKEDDHLPEFSPELPRFFHLKLKPSCFLRPTPPFKFSRYLTYLKTHPTPPEGGASPIVGRRLWGGSLQERGVRRRQMIARLVRRRRHPGYVLSSRFKSRPVKRRKKLPPLKPKMFLGRPLPAGRHISNYKPNTRAFKRELHRLWRRSFYAAKSIYHWSYKTRHGYRKWTAKYFWLVKHRFLPFFKPIFNHHWSRYAQIYADRMRELRKTAVHQFIRHPRLRRRRSWRKFNWRGLKRWYHLATGLYWKNYYPKDFFTRRHRPRRDRHYIGLRRTHRLIKRKLRKLQRYRLLRGPNLHFGLPIHRWKRHPFKKRKRGGLLKSDAFHRVVSFRISHPEDTRKRVQKARSILRRYGFNPGYDLYQRGVRRRGRPKYIRSPRYGKPARLVYVSLKPAPGPTKRDRLFRFRRRFLRVVAQFFNSLSGVPYKLSLNVRRRVFNRLRRGEVFRVFIQLMIRVGFRIKKRGGAKIRVPGRITHRRSQSLVRRWLKKAVNARRERHLVDRVVGEFRHPRLSFQFRRQELNRSMSGFAFL